MREPEPLCRKNPSIWLVMTQAASFECSTCTGEGEGERKRNAVISIEHANRLFSPMHLSLSDWVGLFHAVLIL
jgi:hypothetical protein